MKQLILLFLLDFSLYCSSVASFSYTQDKLLAQPFPKKKATHVRGWLWCRFAPPVGLEPDRA